MPNFNKVIDLNRAQLRSTDKPLAKIKEFREKYKDASYTDMQKRIQEMRDEIRPMVEKIPFERKISLKKIDRTQDLPKEEKEIQAKLYTFAPEVYAMVDEVYFRKMGFRYHDVQLRAGITLAQGQRLVELYTGEGKTMTFQLPLILYSIVGRGAHLVTVNDYLSKRDGEYAGHVAAALGLTVGIINSATSFKFIPDEEIEMYKGENRPARNATHSVAGGKIQISHMDGSNLVEVGKRESYECDITYGTNNEFGFDYLRDNMAWDLKSLSQRELYFCVIDEADSILIDEARTPLIISGVPNDANIEKYIKFARAVDDLVEEKDYTIDHKSRTVVLTEDGIKHVEGNLGAENLWKDFTLAYHIENALKAKAMFNNDEHYLVKDGEVLIVDEFTGRILKGRRYSEGLHQAIEAKEGVQVQQESRTFATITFQNFFRLYKVLAGGSGTIMTEAEEFYKIYGLESVPIPTDKPVIRVDSADKIYKTQEAKFKAAVEEVKELNAKGLPVLIGTTSVDKSEVVSRLLDVARIPHEVLNAKYHEQEAKIIEKAGRKGAVTVATNMAGRGADIVIGGGSRGDAAYEEIKALGGLQVIGTERHEARRIDNQLRGRTGRQGEPGASKFYVSMEDQLMKVLGGEMMSKLMGSVGLADDMPIELGMISRQIEGSQKRIEGMNFDSRKNIVDYDDVMNQHREIFYTRRRNFLQFAEEASGKFNIKGVIVDVTTDRQLNDEFKDRMETAKKNFEHMVSKLTTKEILEIIESKKGARSKLSKEDLTEIIKKIFEFVPEYVLAKALDLPVNQLPNHIAEKIAITNQKELIKYVSDLSEKVVQAKKEEFGGDFYYIGKALILQSMDNRWVDHLEFMKDIREGIGLLAYAQRDPLVEYKNEAFLLFQLFIDKINAEIVKQLLTLQRTRQQELLNAQPTFDGIETNQAQIEDVLIEDREFVASDAKASSSVLKSVDKERARMGASLDLSSIGGKRAVEKAFEGMGRNDKVSVKYIADGKVVKDVKFKKVEKDLIDGIAVLMK